MKPPPTTTPVEASLSSSSSHESSNSSDDPSLGTGTRDDVSVERPAAIGSHENKAVVRLKAIVFLVLMVAALGFAATVFGYMLSQEDAEFRKQFENDSLKVFDAFRNTLDQTLGSFDSLAIQLVSTAQMSNQTWPFVTMSNFAVRMSKVLPLSHAVVIYVAPVVTPALKKLWESYSIRHDDWVDEGVAVQDAANTYFGPVIFGGAQQRVIHGDFEDMPDNITRVMLPTWQNYPVVPNSTYTYNWDFLSLSYPDAYYGCLSKHEAVLTEPYMIPPPDDPIKVEETKLWADFYRNFLEEHEEPMEPMSDFVYPIVAEASNQVSVAGADGYDPSNHTVVGVIMATLYWRSLIHGILPVGSRGIVIVFANPCTDAFTYELDGPLVTYLGVGDKHDQNYDDRGVRKTLYELHSMNGQATTTSKMYSGAKLDKDHCPMTLHLYPSNRMKADFTTSTPLISTAAVLFIFAFVSLVFYLYDNKVERRQQTVMKTAVRSTAIVSSLFPSEVRDRLLPETTGANGNTGISGTAIAELYPDTTVLFADIAGFTEWSSARTPCQVFTLLETIYAAFDAIAKKRGVFKVETIGDCYVAVVGLPTPKKHHALVMARFAYDIRNSMLGLAAELAKSLGPGTDSLALRIGLNSGPTTAGVLRGEKSRFQLFGDTVNTAARMESNGERNKIQVSQKTAELLEIAGKGNWLTMRSEKIECKGKGMMTTYWCEPRVNATSGSAMSCSDVSGSEDMGLEPYLVLDTVDLITKRLVDWNVDLLREMIQEVLSQRAAREAAHEPTDVQSAGSLLNFTGNPVDEVTEVLNLPDEAPKSGTTSKVQISDNVVSQLRDLIASIAGMYQSNPFHNFEHCCHVAMSAKKLLSRIVGCEGGMTIDALTQFAIVFGAVIHDVGHPGVSNSQLVKENGNMAVKYSGQSVAEQNSVDLAWQMLMQSRFNELRTCLCPSKAELQRFRQVVVNVVMATDLFDKNLKALRDARWEKSFSAGSDETAVEALHGDDLMRRKTIVIELIIQASDVSHTMQHFTVYKKWNSNLMKEMYKAYHNGRLVKDPTDGWYEGELWFFDNYVIPLAQKLRECQVFGVSCDEFLDYAKDNRMEWEMKGRDIVRLAVQEFRGQPHPGDQCGTDQS